MEAFHQNTRMVELWIKYRFDCKCERCSMTPMGYADNSLGKVGLPGKTLQTYVRFQINIP